MNIEFSLLQRLSVEALLNQQRGNVSDLITVFDLTNKVKVEDRDSFIKVLPNGQAIVDNDVLNKAPIQNVDLEKAESRKLLEILKSHDGFGPSDLTWVLPLKKQLEAVD